MKRKPSFLVALASIAIIVLLGLAAYLTVYLNEETSIPVKQAASPENTDLQVIEPSSTTVSSTKISPVFGSPDYQESPHSYLFLGDSRMVGMHDALAEKDLNDTCTFIAKEGEGFEWLYDKAVLQLEEALKENPDATVIFNLGVNDLGDLDNYISFYKELFAAYHDPHFYIMSVNPVNDELCKGANNKEIKTFNNAMQAAFPDQYLDCYTYLVSEDFDTIDGLHYTDETSIKIHHFAVMTLTAK